MLVQLNIDSNNYMCQYLSYMDILCYKMINKIHHKLVVLPNFKDIFMKRLVEHEVADNIDEADLFCNKLSETGAYVTGSFILDCLFNTNIHQDIDIYDHTSGLHNPDYFRKTGDNNPDFIKYSTNNLKFTQFLYASGFHSVNTSAGVRPILRSFIKTSHPKYKYYMSNDTVKQVKNTIQIVPVNIQPKHNEQVIPRFISACFDLEICQNIFDGHKIYIKNVNKLIYKYDYIKINTLFIAAFYNTDPTVVDSQDITRQRMEKYIQRGFNIQMHPKQDEMFQLLCTICDEAKEHKNQHLLKSVESGRFDLSKYDTD